MRVFLSPLALRRDSRRTGAGAPSRSRGVRRRSVVVDAERLEGRRLLAAAAAVAPPMPLGPEFAVNSHTANSQELFPESPCAVAAAADGSFVVTWSSSGQDGSSWGVYAQRFDSGGARRGPEFLVNQSTANSQWYPTVACDPGGDFVITWTSYLQDGNESGVYARRYSAAGQALGDEFRVNSTTTGNQRQSTVAIDADGDFIIAWAGHDQSGGAGWDVYAQRYSPTGAKQAGEFRVNFTVAGDQQFASVAAGAAGDFVIAWTTDSQDGSGTAVCARRYDAGGAARGPEFQVNIFALGNQQYARVAAGAAGDFVVAWTSAGQDGSGRGIFARRYDAAGAALGDEFGINQTTAGDQLAPTIAVDSGGGFVVTWMGLSQDGSLFDVYARAYGADGAALGGEFRVNTTVEGNQAYASVAGDGNGGLVIAWESDGQDGSFFGIFGRRYGPAAATPASVVGSHLFYNESVFDGDNGGADAADDDAIAPDKFGLLPAASSTFANYSSYSRGINGVMLDVAGLVLPGTAVALGPEDFDCQVGNGGDSATWGDGPAPESVSVRPGAGALGSDRVTLIWPDGAIKNEWLRLTVKASARTRLAAPDVFYFGNLIGDTGGAAGEAAVLDRMDVILTRRAFSTGPTEITSPYDHNRDGRVNLLDILLIRRNAGQPPLEPLNALPTPGAAGATSESFGAVAGSLLSPVLDPITDGTDWL